MERQTRIKRETGTGNREGRARVGKEKGKTGKRAPREPCEKASGKVNFAGFPVSFRHDIARALPYFAVSRFQRKECRKCGCAMLGPLAHFAFVSSTGKTRRTEYSARRTESDSVRRTEARSGGRRGRKLRPADGASVRRTEMGGTELPSRGRSFRPPDGIGFRPAGGSFRPRPGFPLLSWDPNPYLNPPPLPGPAPGSAKIYSFLLNMRQISI